MSAQKGKDFLLKIDDGSGDFVTIAGLRTHRLALNADPVDVTNMESAGRWRELLEGAGVFKDAASDALTRQTFFDGSIRAWQVIIPSFGIISGMFQLSSLDYRGEHSAEVTFELALESAGALTFVAL